MNIKTVSILNPNSLNFILGQSHFIKTVEDVHEAVIQTVPGIQFGLAFCESSGPRLVRSSGTDETCISLAVENALQIAAGHHFILFMKNAFPINILPVLRNISEMVTLFCATANPVEVIVAETEQGRGILGVIDGQAPLSAETREDAVHRKMFLRKIGYKLS